MEIDVNEVSVVYTDFFTEAYKIDDQELERIMKAAKDERRADFYIGEKQFFKEDIVMVATPNCTIQFH